MTVILADETSFKVEVYTAIHNFAQGSKPNKM